MGRMREKEREGRSKGREVRAGTRIKEQSSGAKI